MWMNLSLAPTCVMLWKRQKVCFAMPWYAHFGEKQAILSYSIKEK